MPRSTATRSLTTIARSSLARRFATRCSAPGKRLRPRLVLMAAEACGGSVDAALPAACAVEMVHAYSLVHDDLPAMDDDDLRRGRPTCHKVYGEAVAILVGDALLARAFEVMATEIQPAAVAAKCCAILGRRPGQRRLWAVRRLIWRWRSDGDELANGDLRELEAIHRRKTGALIRRSLGARRHRGDGTTTNNLRHSRRTAKMSAWRFKSPTTCSTCPAARRRSASGWPRTLTVAS